MAFATSLGFGDLREEIIYDSKIMRQHFFNYLRNKRMERFPVQDGNAIQHCKRKTLVIEVFCSCRKTYNPDGDVHKFEEWFHFDCERIPKSAIDDKDIDFFVQYLVESPKSLKSPPFRSIKSSRDFNLLDILRLFDPKFHKRIQNILNINCQSYKHAYLLYFCEYKL